MLLAHAKVRREQLQRALEIQRESGDFLGEILVREGVLDENSLVAFLAKYCKIPHLSLLDYIIDAKLLELVPPEFCRRHRLVPIDKMGRNLTVAMVNPLDSNALEALHESCPDLRIKPILCTTKHFVEVTRRLFKRYTGEIDFPDSMEMPGAKPGDNAAATPTAESIPAEAARPDLAAPAVKTFSVSAHLDEEDEIPFAVEYHGPVDANGRPIVTDEHREALLDSVFSTSRTTGQDNEGDHGAVGDNAAVEQVARKMATAMVESMHNAYQVLERRVRFFHGIAPEMIAKLFSRGKTVEYEAGQIVFCKGDAAACMFIVLNGAVEIVDEGRHLALLQKGEIFGEMALVCNAERSATAQTVSETSLLMLSFDDITQGLDSTTSVQLLVNIIMTLSSRLVKMQAR